MQRSVLRVALVLAAAVAALVIRPIAPQATLLLPDTSVATASHVAVHPAGPGAVLVSWSTRSQQGVDAWVVRVVDSADGQVTGHDRLALPGQRSLLVGGLPTGSTATATVQTFTGSAAAGLASASSPVRVPTGLCAGARRQCLSVDARRRLGPERHVAQGLLHGLEVSRRGADYVRALDPRFWRISAGNQTETQRAGEFTADTTALLSDAWPGVGRDPRTGATMSPWQDWSAYRAFVTDQVRARIAGHDLPDFWEVQNEPDVASYYNPAAPPTAALVLQQFRVAYDAIRRVLPHAKVIGPSLSAYTLVGNAQHVGLADFIEFATLHGLRFAAVSWHELNAGSPSDAQRQLPGLVDRVQTVRTLLTASPVLRHAGIFINEFDSPWIGRQVGWDLGHVAALEQARVTQANRACFEVCSGGADSLLDPNDGTTPRMTYWGRLAYEHMTGQRLATTTSDRDTTAMAALGRRGLTVILSRHAECAVHVPATCPTARGLPGAGSGRLVLPMRLPGQISGEVTVRLTQMSATQNDVLAAPTSTRLRVRVGPSHLLRLHLPTITNGGATVVEVHWN